MLRLKLILVSERGPWHRLSCHVVVVGSSSRDHLWQSVRAFETSMGMVLELFDCGFCSKYIFLFFAELRWRSGLVRVDYWRHLYRLRKALFTVDQCTYPVSYWCNHSDPAHIIFTHQMTWNFKNCDLTLGVQWIIDQIALRHWFSKAPQYVLFFHVKIMSTSCAAYIKSQ